MHYKGRAQCLVIRDGKILMVKHCFEDDAHYTTPGGGIEPGETPEQAALRELQEECNVTGGIVKKTSEWKCPLDDDTFLYTYQVDIGEQTPSLGHDPELTADKQCLAEVRWLALDEISEVDRVYLWSAGLMSIPEFAREVGTWVREISYPSRRGESVMKIRLVTHADIPKWIALSREFDCYVLELVPDLSEWYNGNEAEVSFEVYMNAKIAKQEAFMAVDKREGCLGIIAISKKNNNITFFGVSHNVDVQSVGHALLTHALAQLDSSKPVRSNIMASAAPRFQAKRELYLACGFAHSHDSTECGVPVNTFVKR